MGVFLDLSDYQSIVRGRPCGKPLTFHLIPFTDPFHVCKTDTVQRLIEQSPGLGAVDSSLIRRYLTGVQAPVDLVDDESTASREAESRSARIASDELVTKLIRGARGLAVVERLRGNGRAARDGSAEDTVAAAANTREKAANELEETGTAHVVDFPRGSPASRGRQLESPRFNSRGHCGLDHLVQAFCRAMACRTASVCRVRSRSPKACPERPAAPTAAVGIPATAANRYRS